MKNYKRAQRAQRRWDAKCKFEKRIKLWVPANKTMLFITDEGFQRLSSAEVRNRIRKGECWNFLKWTSTPCSCSMCSYPKYERPLKSDIQKQIWKDIQDEENGSVV